MDIIYGYKFSDSDISSHNKLGDRYEIYVHSTSIELDRNDVVMLANHFKLTADDLNHLCKVS